MSTTSSQEKRTQLDHMDVTNPDVLLNARKSTSTPVSVGIAVVLHVAILGISSTALFVDWANHGVHLPATIRTIKEDIAAAEQAKIDAAAEQAAKAEEEAAKKAETQKPEENTPAQPEARTPVRDIGDEDPFGDL